MTAFDATEQAYKNGYAEAEKTISELRREIVQLRAERDAAVADLKFITEFFSDCTMCKNIHEHEVCDYCGTGDKSKWEWRGVQKNERI